MGYNLNGNIINDQGLDLSLTNNGSFWYGDGFFDAMMFDNDKVHFSNFHWDRLVHSCHVLKMNNPFINEVDFVDNVKRLANLTPHQTQRIKLVVWRHANQGYRIIDGTTEFLITTNPIQSKPYELNINGLSLATYTDNLKSFSPLGNIKSTSSALYVLATQYAQASQTDDAIILNTYLRPIETARMNLYLIKGDRIQTPGLEEGCLNGIMRRVMIKLCNEHDISLIEQPIEPMDLEECDGVILTSAIQGIQWVNRINEQVFHMSPLTVRLHEWLYNAVK